MDSATPRTWVRSSTPARVEDILAKACDVLARDGYADFNLRKVAAEVGVRLRTIQYHFASRDALLAAAITKSLEDWGSDYVRIVSRSDGPERKLRDIQRLSLELVEKPSTIPLVVECFALAQHNAVIRDVVQSLYYRYRRLFADVLREIRPDLSADELMGFATVFAAQMEGLNLLLRRDDPHLPNESALRRALDSQCDAFVAALRAYRGRSRHARVAKSKRASTAREGRSSKSRRAAARP